MSGRILRRSLIAGAGTALALPAVAMAQDEPSIGTVVDELNVVWVLVAAVLVMFMQAGFAFLEIGFSRGKNAGMGIAKILVNFSIATIAWWACGFAFAFGGSGAIIGDSGFFFSVGETIKGGLVEGPVTGSTAAFMLFQFMFCAVSLAIVWGTTLERLKFVAYVIYAVVFAAIIYPLSAHWIFGGGFLSEIGGGVQDFAGSTVVHLVGATGALACLLLLGARRGKYGPDGKPRAIPGHSMPLVGLGVLILWLGWFGFNGGSTLGTSGSRFAEVMLVTQLGAAAGVIGACLVTYFKTRSLDVGMAGNGAIAGLVGITAPSGYVEFWAAPIIGLVAGVLVVYAVLAIEQEARRPGRRAVRARPRGCLGHALLRPLHLAPGWPSSTASASPACSTRARSSSSACRRVGVGAAFITVIVLSCDHLLGDQEDGRPAGRRRGGGSRPRHRRARHVRLPGAVHPAARAVRERRVPADRGRHADRAGAQRARSGAVTAVHRRAADDGSLIA